MEKQEAIFAPLIKGIWRLRVRMRARMRSSGEWESQSAFCSMKLQCGIHEVQMEASDLVLLLSS